MFLHRGRQRKGVVVGRVGGKRSGLFWGMFGCGYEGGSGVVVAEAGQKCSLESSFDPSLSRRFRRRDERNMRIDESGVWGSLRNSVGSYRRSVRLSRVWSGCFALHCYSSDRMAFLRFKNCYRSILIFPAPGLWSTVFGRCGSICGHCPMKTCVVLAFCLTFGI